MANEVSMSGHTPIRDPNLDNALTGGAYMAHVPQQQPNSVYGDTGVQLTDEQKNKSVFC